MKNQRALNGIVHTVQAVLQPSWLSNTLRDRFSNDADLSIFFQLVSIARLDFGAPGSLSLLAPTNEAFAQIPAERMAFLQSLTGAASLREILLYHVLSGVLPLYQLEAGPYNTLLEETTVQVTEGPIQFNGANVVEEGILASNGILHKIDRVLNIPPGATSGPTFAPTSKVTAPTPGSTLSPQISGDFCWRDSYGRGVGTIPDTCPEDREQHGLLCYSKCADGFENAPATVDCHQVCPQGWRNDGLFCRLAEYGRGFGYPWQFSDPLNNLGMFARCEAENSTGNCEESGLVVYPKCREGVSPFGCCICRPAIPDCLALGFATQFDLSCGKTIRLGDPTLRNCAAGLQYDAGLCYTPCRMGFNGVGPVCWGQAPPGWVDCGFGASPNSGKCAEIIVDQVLSVANTVLFFATLGTSGAANTATAPLVKGTSKWSKAVTKFRDIQSKLPNVLEKYPNAEKAYEVYQKAGEVKTLVDIARLDPETQEPEDLVRMVTTMASLFDPTGVTGIIAAYTFALCSAILDNTRL
jgi:hypothetical protein